MICDVDAFFYLTLSYLSYRHAIYLQSHQIDYEVGDFVIEGGNSSEELEVPEIHRIAAAYQACKSFIGKWSTDSDQIQKRGELIFMSDIKFYFLVPFDVFTTHKSNCKLFINYWSMMI